MCGVFSSGIVIHHEWIAEEFLVHTIHRALILCHVFPPLGVLVFVRHHRLARRLPRMSLRHVELRRGQSDAQRSVHRLIAGALSSDVCHPVASLVSLYLIGAAPGVVYERRESSALVSVPFVAASVFEHSAECLPVEQVAAGGNPCLVASAVGAAFAVVAHVGHKPLAVLAEHRRTVYLVAVVGRCHHHSVFVWRLHGLVDALHLLLRHCRRSGCRAVLAAALGCCADCEQEAEGYYKIYSFHNPF